MMPGRTISATIIGWINQAKSDATRRKRIDQMVSELKSGGVYMGMKHKPSTKR